MGSEKKIFLAATRQNDGKTVIGIGLLFCLQQLFPRVGFMKPVGQEYIEIGKDKIDKDAVLAGRLLGIPPERFRDLSPIAVDRGFTERYLDGVIRHRDLLETVIASYERCAEGKDFMLIEGTGHAGVGSIFDLNNAQVARCLGAGAVLVTTAGIGRPIDEVILNKALFDREGVPLVGVIINKVQAKKMNKLRDYLEKGLRRHGIPLLGMVPYTEPLTSATMDQVREGLGLDIVHGRQYLHHQVKRRIIGAMFPHSALKYLKAGTLLITPGDREDLILTALRLVMTHQDGRFNLAGIIVTGGIRPHRSIVGLLKTAPIPILSSRDDTYRVASRVHDLIVKLRETDRRKIVSARQLVARYVDMERMLSLLPGGAAATPSRRTRHQYQ